MVNNESTKLESFLAVPNDTQVDCGNKNIWNKALYIYIYI